MDYCDIYYYITKEQVKRMDLVWNKNDRRGYKKKESEKKK